MVKKIDKKDITVPNHNYIEMNYVAETATGK